MQVDNQGPINIFQNLNEKFFLWYLFNSFEIVNKYLLYILIRKLKSLEKICLFTHLDSLIRYFEYLSCGPFRLKTADSETKNNLFFLSLGQLFFIGVQMRKFSDNFLLL